MKIEIPCSISLDDITYQLQCNLSTKRLVDFALLLGDNLSESEEFYRLLKQSVNKLKLE